MGEFDATRERYISVWRRLLRRFLNWSDAQIEEWVSKLIARFRGLGMEEMLFHDPPTAYVVPLLMPADLVNRLEPDDRLGLRRCLEGALDAGDPFRDFDTEAELAAVSERVAETIRQFRDKVG